MAITGQCFERIHRRDTERPEMAKIACEDGEVPIGRGRRDGGEEEDIGVRIHTFRQRSGAFPPARRPG